MSSIILTPIPITQDNLNVPIDAGWITQDVLCQGRHGWLRRRGVTRINTVTLID